MKLSIQQLKIVFAGAFLVLMATFIFSIESMEKLSKAFKWLNNTHRVLIYVESVFSAYQEVETNFKGYLVSKDPHLYNAYKTENEKLIKDFRILHTLTSDNPVQQEHIRDMLDIINERTLIYKRRLEKPLSIIEQYTFKKSLSYRLKFLIERIKVEENRLLKLRNIEVDKAEKVIRNYIILGFTLGILMFCVLFFIMLSEIKRRKITEQILIEKDKTLEKTKEFDFFANSLPQIIWMASKEGIINYFCKNWFYYTGRTVEEAHSMDLRTAIHPDDIDLLISEWMKCVGNGKNFNLEYRIKNFTTGEYKWFLSMASAMKDAQGNTIKWFGASMDINDQKENETKYKQSSELYHQLINSESYALYFLDKNGIINSWNIGAEKIKGYTEKEIVGKHYSIFLPEDVNAQGFSAYALEMARTKGKFEDNGYRIRKDGSSFWANIVISAIYNKENDLLGYSKITRDLTEIKNAEELLKAQNKELTAFRKLAIDEMQKKTQILNGIISYMPVLIFRINSSGFVIETLGKISRHPQKIYNLKIGNIFESFSEYTTELKKAIEGEKQVFIVEDEGFYEFNLFPDNVVNSGIICFVSDITEKMKADNKIKDNETLFKGLLESAPDAMIIANEDGEIELINTQTKKLFGFDMEELIGFRIEKLLPYRFFKNYNSYLENYSRDPNMKKMGSHIELLARKKDGTEFPVEISISPLELKNSQLVSASIRDVTERKQVEDELLKSRAAALHANTSKSMFLANMSHEIRTPLNAIIGFSDLMAKEQHNPEQQKEYLQYITSSGNLLLKLIGDILDISKIEEGKLHLEKKSFCFKEVISSSVLPYKYKANEKGLDFALNFDNALPDYLIGDGYRISQVIINLIGNALKFTKEGKISVSFSVPFQDESADNITLQIDVSDTGIGIPIEKQAFVFETFTQADNTIGREYGGSGLGLTIVKKLIEMMQGEIRIISPVNESSRGGTGCTFSIQIPMQVDKITLKPVFQKKSLSGNTLDENLCVLVVEDNLVNQRLAKAILKRLVGNTDFASNGQEAVDMIKIKNYSLIFMDVQMPVMDGYEATKVIRTHLNLSVPVIGLTANVFKEDIENCKNAGMNDYLGKPYSEEQISDIINKWAIRSN